MLKIVSKWHRRQGIIVLHVCVINHYCEITLKLYCMIMMLTMTFQSCCCVNSFLVAMGSFFFLQSIDISFLKFWQLLKKTQDMLNEHFSKCVRK